MKKHQSETPPARSNHAEETSSQHTEVDALPDKPIEVGGPKGPEPTRYGDWENAGRCTDF